MVVVCGVWISEVTLGLQVMIYCVCFRPGNDLGMAGENVVRPGNWKRYQGTGRRCQGQPGHAVGKYGGAVVNLVDTREKWNSRWIQVDTREIIGYQGESRDTRKIIGY